MIGKGRIAAVITAGMVVCAVGLTAANVRDAYRRAHRPASQPEATVPDWRAFAAVGHRIGAPTAARATVTVFFDYQCGACRTMARRLDALLEDHPTSIAAVIRHYPLRGNLNAMPAARAVECASIQGRFREFHDRLLAEPEGMGWKPWAAYAEEAGVPDIVAFSDCLTDPQVDAIIQVDMKAADRLGVSATPTWLLNEEKYVGDVWDLPSLIERHLERSGDLR